MRIVVRFCYVDIPEENKTCGSNGLNGYSYEPWNLHRLSGFRYGLGICLGVFWDDYDAPAFPINGTALMCKFPQAQAEEETILSDSTRFEVRMAGQQKSRNASFLTLLER